MAFTRVLADDVVEAIFDDDFGLSDEDESDFEGGPGGDDIHAFLGETVLRREEVMGDYMDEENTSESDSEGKYDDDVDMLEPSSEREGEREGLSRASDTYTADPCVRRITGGERRRREIEVRKPKVYTRCSV